MTVLRTETVGEIYLVTDGLGGHIFSHYATRTDANFAARFHGVDVKVFPIGRVVKS